MTKSELADAVCGRTGISKDQVVEVIEHTALQIIESVSEGDTVILRGFGAFEPKVRKEKIGRNIAQKTQVTIPKTVVPDFKPYPDFKDAVAKGLNHKL